MSFDTTISKIYELTNKGIKIWTQDGKLKLFVPNSVLLADKEEEFLKANKQEILEYLQKAKIYSKEYDFLILSDRHQSCRFILSFAQERLWFIEQYEGGTNAYNISKVFKLSDKIRLDVLENSLKSIIDRHEILRTLIKEDEQGNAYQTVLDTEQIYTMKRMTVTNLVQLDEELSKEVKRRYNLNQECPFRVCLYELVDGDEKTPPQYYLSIVVHHIAFDGWSVRIFLNELQAYYCYYISKLENLEVSLNLPELTIQYKDFALWQRSYLSGERFDKQLAYWRNKLRSYETLNLITDKPRPVHIDYVGAEVNFEIDEKISIKLRKLAKDLKVSLYSLLLSGYYLMLKTYSNQDDIVIGMPLANRHYNPIENLIGFFVNSLPLRTVIESSKTVEEFIQQVGRDVVEAQLYQDIPFEKLVEELKVSKDTSRHPIFQVMFSLESKSTKQHYQLYDLLKPYIIKNGLYNVAKFDISTTIYDSQIKIKGNFNYTVKLYTKPTITGFIKTYTEILKQLASLSEEEGKQKKIKISDLVYLAPEDYKQIIKEWNQTDKTYPFDKMIHQLFAEQVERNPEHIAIICEGRQLTYRELNIRANQFAHYIKQNQDIEPDTLIALCLERSEHTLIAMLAVLKSGGAYVPIDPSYPDERIKYLLEDTDAKLLLTNVVHESRLKAIGMHRILNNQLKILSVDSERLQAELLEQATSTPKTDAKSTNLAYVIYTSGTTGHPKGVMVEHKGVVNLLLSMQEIYDLNEEDGFLFYRSYVFDASLEETILPLIVGGKLNICSTGLRDLNKFLRILEEQPITAIHLNSETAGSIEDHIKDHINKNNSIKKVLSGGTELKLKSFSHFLRKGITIFNAYGPAECTVNSTVFVVNSLKEEWIGKPIYNITAYVVDRDLRPLPIGAIGELYIGGAGVARGYLNQRELTEERFIADPFQTAEEKNAGRNGRLYKTGDWVRWLPDGNLEYIGRTDFQVKIRGYRIELGEIENILSNYEGIKQCVVVTKEQMSTDGQKSGNKYLVGYYVSEAKLDEAKLNNYLSSHLPEYMVPSTLVYLEKLPLTINGKLDRQALPDPKFVNKEHYVAPRNELEKKICQIWGVVLGIPEEKIGIQEDFFKIGGDSIVSIQLVSRLRQRLGLNVSVKDIFTYKTIERLYDHVLSKESSDANKVVIKAEQGVLSGEVPLLPIQEWFFESHFAVMEHWNQSFLIRVPQLDIKRLKASVEKLIQHHDSFRLRYKKDDHVGWIQYYDSAANASENELKFLDIKTLKVSEESQEFVAVTEEIFTSWQENFNLEHGPVYSIGYVEGYADGSARIFFALHHLIVDGVSWRILLEDLKALYDGKDLGIKGSSYRQWVEIIRLYGKNHEDEKAYWSTVLSDYETEKLNHFSETTIQSSFSLTLSMEETEKLLRESNKAYRTQINDLLLTALGFTLTEITKSKVNHIILEGHGREELDNHIDITRTLGWFTTMYPVRLEIKNEIGSSIKLIKENLRHIPQKGIGYGALFGYKNNILPRMSFNYLGQFDKEGSDTILHPQEKEFWSIVNECSGWMIHKRNQNTNIISIVAAVIDSKLGFNIVSNLKEIKADKFGSLFEQNLRNIVTHCTNRPTIEYKFSDQKDFEPYVIFNEEIKEDVEKIFIFPPGSSGAESYFRNIVPKLKNKNLIIFNNFYYYLSNNFGGDHVKYISYEELANEYINCIKQIQPKGPYNLFGWSFGGVLAFEIAKQLIEKGDQVENLAILDSFFNYRKAVLATNTQLAKANTINYNYFPLLDPLIFKDTNIVLFKAMVWTPFEKENKIMKYYVDNAPYNHLDDLLGTKEIKVIALNSTHSNWVDDDSQVTKICIELLSQPRYFKRYHEMEKEEFEQAIS